MTLRPLLAVAVVAGAFAAPAAGARCDDVLKRLVGHCLPVCTATYEPIQRVNEALDPHAYVAPCVH